MPNFFITSRRWCPKSIEKTYGEKLQFFINFNDRFDSGGQYLLSKGGLGFLKVQQR